MSGITRFEQEASDKHRWPTIPAAALVLFLAAGFQHRLGPNTDVSWLLTVCERMLAGERLYLDVVELNPPASVFLYLPQTALASLLGIAPEAVLVVSVLALAVLSLWLSARLLQGTSHKLPLPLALAILLLVPGASFAQREHFAVLFLLPWLALLVRRSEHLAIPSRQALLAGLGTGLAVAIKPHFALAAGLPMLLTLRGSTFRQLITRPEVAAAALVALAYGAGVFFLAKDFLRFVVPLVGDGYLLARQPLRYIVKEPMLLLALLASGSAWLVAAREQRSRLLIPLLSAAGFALAMLVQGKNFPNHHLPILLLGFLALTVATTASKGARCIIGAVLLLVLGGDSIYVASQANAFPGAVRLIVERAPSRPTIMVAATNLSVGHPLTRRVGGRFVGTRGSLWVTGSAFQALDRTSDPSRVARLRRAITEDRRLWVADVARRRPDLILVDGDEGWGWIRRFPEVRSAMQPYRTIGKADGLLLMVRAR